MSYLLIVLSIVAVILVILFWYLSRYYTITDDDVLDLMGDDNLVTEKWIKSNIEGKTNFDRDGESTASRLLQRNLNIEVNPNDLVVGLNLAKQFRDLTNINIADNQIFDMRAILGIPGEIMIVKDSKIKSILRRQNDLDISLINIVMENDLDTIACKYLSELLTKRWQLLQQSLFGIAIEGNITNNNSYAYLESCNLPKVELLDTNKGKRLNMLCSDRQFDALIKRSKELKVFH